MWSWGVEFLQPHYLLIDDALFVVDGVLVVADDLVELLDGRLAAIDSADGLLLLELVYSET